MTYDFSIVLRVGDDEHERIDASLAPCREDFRMRSVVAGAIANDGSMPELEVSPEWSTEGAPVVSALTLRATGSTERYDVSIFDYPARRAAKKLAAERDIDLDRTKVSWWVEAHPADDDIGAVPLKGRFRRRPYPLIYTRLAPLPGVPLLSVRIHKNVQAAGRRHLLDCPTVEVGGLLLGSLLFDPDLKRVEVNATEYLPLEPSSEVGASAAHFGFGVETFRKATAALRNGATDPRSRVVLAWSHSHVPCAACFATSACRNDTIFFSPDDYGVHASAFPLAYQVATVFGKASDKPAIEPDFRAYAWQHGAIAEIPCERGQQ